MSKQISYSSGCLAGFHYLFDNAGDSIREHKHDTAHLHNVICLRGSIEVNFPDRIARLLPGEVFDFDGAVPHTITALEPGSAVLNLYLNGPPADFDPHYNDNF